MKILLVGYHNPHFVNTIVLREKALEYLGHEVIAFNESSFFLPGRLRQWSSPLQAWDLKRLNQDFVRTVNRHKPDLVLVVGGHMLLPESIEKVKNFKIPIILWTTDVPLEFDNILAGAKFYTHLFCAGSEAVDIFHQQGFKNVSWACFACDPHYHKKLNLSSRDRKQYGRDIAFVGSYYPNRARVFETIADLNLGIWGPYWDKLNSHSPLKGKAVNGKLNFHQWVKIFNACKINMVVHYQDGKTPCHQVSPKLFEAMACGCFVLCDRQKDAMELFKDREHLVYFDDEGDLRIKIQYYLEHEDQRLRIAHTGQQEVLTHHRWEDRLKYILQFMAGTYGTKI